MKTITQYFSDDGKQFETRADVEDYELNLKLEAAGLSNFTKQELTIGRGLTMVDHLPYEAPWMGPFGSCVVNIFEVKRGEDGIVKFGVGNEQPPILDWVVADAFYDEWPD